VPLHDSNYAPVNDGRAVSHEGPVMSHKNRAMGFELLWCGSVTSGSCGPSGELTTSISKVAVMRPHAGMITMQSGLRHLAVTISDLHYH
jgi:hypothetical protein